MSDHKTLTEISVFSGSNLYSTWTLQFARFENEIQSEVVCESLFLNDAGGYQIL